MTYNGCNLDKTNGAMNKRTGKFRAKTAGLYRFSFQSYVLPGRKGTASFVKGSTDLAVIEKVNGPTGQGTFGGSIIVQLAAGQEFYVENLIVGGLYSNSFKHTVFEGYLLAAL